MRLVLVASLVILLVAPTAPALPPTVAIEGQLLHQVGLAASTVPLFLPITVSAHRDADGTVQGLVSWDYPTTSGGWNAKFHVTEIAPPDAARDHWCLRLVPIIDQYHLLLVIRDVGDGVLAKDQYGFVSLWGYPNGTCAFSQDYQCATQCPRIAQGDVRIVA